MIDREARAKVLDTENETLRQENRQLKKDLLGAAEAPPIFGLTKSEATMFGILMNKRAPRGEAFTTARYSTEPPDDEIIDVLDLQDPQESQALRHRDQDVLGRMLEGAGGKQGNRRADLEPKPSKRP
jgi:hypothetical protein